MVIHVVAPGDTLFSIAEAYGVPFSLLAIDNGLSAPYQLAVGQALVVQFPRLAHTVRPGEPTSAIAAQYGISLRQLLRNNPVLGGGSLIYPGQTLVIAFQGEKLGALTVNGYAYPFIGQREIQALLPYLTYLTPFTYGITSQGKLIPPDDSTLISTALQSGTAPLLHLSTLTEKGGFSNELASLVLNDMAVQDALIDNLEETVLERGYQGLDVDFEFVFLRMPVPMQTFSGGLPHTSTPWVTLSSRRWRPRPPPIRRASSTRGTTTGPLVRLSTGRFS